ncbi:unnamed protein product [Orchesella dallaii]|uniref:Uncharacterized protein n=1 Tax=Orchesella dallaii TaxID=48710 RepID=A0ABP1S058_9HEXA
MLSQLYYRIHGFQIRWANIVCATPFIWNKATKTLHVTKKSQLLHSICMLLLFLYFCYAAIQTILHMANGQTTDFSFFFLYSITICCAVTLIASYPALARPEEFAATMNNFYRYMDGVKREYMPTFNSEDCLVNKLFNGIFMGISIACPLCGFLVSCHYILFYDWPVYLTSIVPQQYRTWPVIILFGLLYFYGLQMVWAVVLTNSTYFMTTGFYNWLMLNEFLCSNNGRLNAQKTTSNFRDISVIQVYYRRFEMVQTKHVRLVCGTIIPLEAVLLNLAVFCNFCLIAYKHLLTPINIGILLVWSVGGTVFALVGFTYCGALYNKGVKVLGSMRKKDWGSARDNKLMKMFAKSCIPIQIGYGRMVSNPVGEHLVRYPIYLEQSHEDYTCNREKPTSPFKFIYLCYTAIQTILYMMNGQVVDFPFFFLYAVTICCVVTLIASYPALARPEEFAATLNNYHRYMDSMKREYMPTFNSEECLVNKLFNGILIAITVACPLCGLFVNCHYILFQDWSVYPISIVPQQYRTWPVIILFGLDYFYMLQTVWAVVLTNSTYFMTTGFYNWLMLNEFLCSNGRLNAQKRMSKFRDISVIQLNYRKFEMLQIKHLRLVCGTIIPLERVILNLALFCNFCLIAYKPLLAPINTGILLVWSVGGTVFALIGLTYCGALYNKGVKVLGSIKKKDWGSARNNKLIKMFVKSCIPIQIGYGRMYVLRKVNVLKFLRSLTRGTIRVLLMWKKQT